MGPQKNVKGQQDSKHNERLAQIEHIQSQLGEIKNILGFRAVVLVGPKGNILSIDSVDKELNLRVVSNELVTIYSQTGEAAQKIGFGQCKETVIKTSKGIIVMQGAAYGRPRPFCIIVILSTEGNLALMRMKIEQLIQFVMAIKKA